MLEHVLNLGNQLKTDLVTSEGFKSVDYKRILIVGMGGSGVVGDVLKLILNQHTNIDVEVRKTYNLSKTQIAAKPFCLFISYSGNTEETVSVAKDAINENLDWAVISSGGELLELASKYSKNFVKVPKGLQPRAAFGFMTKAITNLRMQLTEIYTIILILIRLLGAQNAKRMLLVENIRLVGRICMVNFLKIEKK